LGGSWRGIPEPWDFSTTPGTQYKVMAVNYLIPSDTEISNEAFLKTKAISSQAILEVMQRAQNAVNLVFLGCL
jgi:uncharacterized caspase-like protein